MKPQPARPRQPETVVLIATDPKLAPRLRDALRAAPPPKAPPRPVPRKAASPPPADGRTFAIRPLDPTAVPRERATAVVHQARVVVVAGVTDAVWAGQVRPVLDAAASPFRQVFLVGCRIADPAFAEWSRGLIHDETVGQLAASLRSFTFPPVAAVTTPAREVTPEPAEPELDDAGTDEEWVGPVARLVRMSAPPRGGKRQPRDDRDAVWDEAQAAATEYRGAVTQGRWGTQADPHDQLPADPGAEFPPPRGAAVWLGVWLLGTDAGRARLRDELARGDPHAGDARSAWHAAFARARLEQLLGRPAEAIVAARQAAELAAAGKLAAFHLRADFELCRAAGAEADARGGAWHRFLSAALAAGAPDGWTRAAATLTARLLKGGRLLQARAEAGGEVEAVAPLDEECEVRVWLAALQGSNDRRKSALLEEALAYAEFAGNHARAVQLQLLLGFLSLHSARQGGLYWLDHTVRNSKPGTPLGRAARFLAHATAARSLPPVELLAARPNLGRLRPGDDRDELRAREFVLRGSAFEADKRWEPAAAEYRLARRFALEAANPHLYQLASTRLIASLFNSGNSAALGEALRWASALVPLAEQLGVHRLAGLLQLSRLFKKAGQPARAVAALRETDPLVAAVTPATRAAIEAERGKNHRDCHQLPEAVAAYQEAIRYTLQVAPTVGELPDELRDRLAQRYNSLAAVYVEQRDYPRAVEAGRAALAAYPDGTRSQFWCQVLNNYGMALYLTGRREQGRRVNDLAVEIGHAELTRRRNPTQLLIATTARARMMAAAGYAVGAVELLDRVIRLCAAGGAGDAVVPALVSAWGWKGRFELDSGHAEQARQSFDRVLAFLGRNPMVWRTGFHAYLGLAELAERAGNTQQRDDYYTQARELAVGSGADRLAELCGTGGSPATE